jgi:DNA-binding Lrp family transcriptional regulator
MQVHRDRAETLATSARAASAEPSGPLTAAEEALLRLLQEDARQSLADLARKLGLARATVQERMTRLERKGVIAGYTVRPGPALMAHGVSAHSLARLEPKQTQQTYAQLRSMPQVQAVYAISGEFDALIVLRAANTAELDAALDELGRLPGVLRTQTSVVLSVKFER